ncbi:MAG: hypothetical protein Kow0063_44870 [Anaerolineae bacterium]
MPIDWAAARHAQGVEPLLEIAINRVWPDCPKKDKVALAKHLEDRLTQGTAVALIDDWAELSLLPEESARQLRAGLSRWRRLLVFGRYRPRSRDLSIGEVFQLTDLNDQEVRRFVREWASVADQPLDSETLISHISTSKVLRDLARVPWLLDLICKAASIGIEHVQTRWTLLRWAMDQLLEKEAPGGLDREYFQDALADLAWYGHLHIPVQYEFDASEVRELWCHKWGQERGERFLGLAYEGGLLRQDRGGKPFAFPHPAIQALLTADAWLKRDGWLDHLEQVKSQPPWADVVIFAAAQLGQTGGGYFRLRDLLSRLCETGESDVFGINWLLAGQCLAELDRSTRENLEHDGIGRQIREHLLGWLMQAPCAMMYYQARDVLSQLGTEVLIEDLIGIASDRQRATSERETAIDLLGELGGEIAIKALKTAALDKNETLGVRDRAVRALGRTGDLEIVDVLTSLLKSPELREAVLEALAEHKSPEATRLLLRESESIQVSSIIEKLDSPKALSELVEQARLEGKAADPPILSAIANIGGEQAIEILTQFLSHEEEYVAEWAVYLLGAMKTPGACEALIAFAEDESQPQVRRSLALSSLPREPGLWDTDRVIGLLLQTDVGQELAQTRQSQGAFDWSDMPDAELDGAMEALMQTSDAQASTHLERALREADDEGRQRIAYVLARRGRPESILLLIQLTRDPDPQVRAEAIFGLGKLGVPDVSDVALTELQWAVERGRSLAELCAALGELREERSVPLLVSALRDNHFSRTAIITALGKIGGVEATRALVDLWHHWVEAGIATHYREQVLQALAQHNEPPAVQTFIEAATHPNVGWSERIKALGYLRRVRNPAAVEVLIEVLSHEDVEVRQATAEALWGIGTDSTATEKAILEMLAMAGNESLGTREAALEALNQSLREIQDPHKVKALARKLSSIDAEVRKTAFAGLERLLTSLVANEILDSELSAHRSRTASILCHLSLAYDLRVMPDGCVSKF